MIRKILLSLCFAATLFLVACKDKNDIESLSQNEVYFFYQQTCPHCHEAAEYIKKHHSDVKIKSLDIAMPGNKKLFQSAARTYKVGMAAGTPLICFGKNHIMGWGADAPKQFDLLAKDYKK